MKLAVRILLSVLCAAMVLAIPFTVSAPNLLEDAKWEMIEVLDAGEEEGLLRLLFPVACAEEDVSYSLPVDNSPGMVPNPALFTEDGYEDDSIRVQMETREGQNGLIWRIAWVEIASPTQLRTGYEGKNVKSDKTELVSVMAQKYNAVVAINGDNYSAAGEELKHSFIIRMGDVRRTKTNGKKDILIIDENGDFHTFIKSKGADTFERDTGHTIVNAFMFGPALVHEGEISTDPGYGYNPNGHQPRAAIGQLDRLSYVLVIADNPAGADDQGVTHRELAEFMQELGCREAYNLDGGNSAVLVFNGEICNNKAGRERDITDLIYFATAVSPEDWNK